MQDTVHKQGPPEILAMPKVTAPGVQKPDEA